MRMTASSQEPQPAEPSAAAGDALPHNGSPFEVFFAFLRLGLTSFGGPVAHLGYFRTEFVDRRKWLDDRSYSDLVALCQFLPGPASSQLGIALGMARAGWLGSFLAWGVYARIAVKRREAAGEITNTLSVDSGWTNDAVALVLGTFIYLALAYVFHPVMIGVPVFVR